MGWLELLPLLRRVLPLLDRLAPMLEGIVAGRVGARAEADRAGGIEAARNHGVLLQAIEEQRMQTLTVAEEVKRLRLSNEVFAARLEISEAQVAKLAGWVKAGAIVTPVLLIALFLLALVLIHRGA